MCSRVSGSALSALCLCASSTHKSAVDGGSSVLDQALPEACDLRMVPGCGCTEVQAVFGVCVYSSGWETRNVLTDLEQVVLQQGLLGQLFFLMPLLVFSHPSEDSEAHTMNSVWFCVTRWWKKNE